MKAFKTLVSLAGAAAIVGGFGLAYARSSGGSSSMDSLDVSGSPGDMSGQSLQRMHGQG